MKNETGLKTRYKPRHKFHAKPTKRDGFHFPSEKEACYYDDLMFQQKAGHVLFFLRQVPFHLPGGVKLVIDFIVFYPDGSCRIIDVKGHKTEQYKAKKRIVEALYPIKIEEV